MFSHVFVGVGNFERALSFYRALMPVLGIEERFCDPARPWAGWQSHPDPRPLFVIGRPFDGLEHEVGNGQMVAFLAGNREVVSRAYATALANGGASEGEPGLRPEYHANYFGAYFRDTEGNKLCVACHSAPAGQSGVLVRVTQDNRSASTDMTAEIRSFFEQYREAFNRLDGEAVARLYAVPSGIASDKGYTHWATFDLVRDNMVALCELYRANGFSSARFEESSFLGQGENHAVVDLWWQIDRVDGQAPWRFNTTYNLVRTSDGWRVLLCTAYEEKRLDA